MNADTRHELHALRSALERRRREVRRLPFLAPDLGRIAEEIRRLEREAQRSKRA